MRNVVKILGYRNLKSYIFYSLFAFVFYMIFSGSDFYSSNITDFICSVFWMSNIFMISMGLGENSKNVFFTLPVSKKEYVTSLYIGEAIQMLVVTMIILGLKFIFGHVFEESSLLNYSYNEVFIMSLLIGSINKIIFIPLSVRYSTVNRRNFIIFMVILGLSSAGIQSMSYGINSKIIGELGFDKSILIYIGIFINTVLLVISYKKSIVFLGKKEVI